MVLRVLIVDDHEDRLDVLEVFLESEWEGASVQRASDGQDALSYYDSGISFDVIISSDQMPLMNGDELLEALRARDVHIPFYLCSDNKRDLSSFENAALLIRSQFFEELQEDPLKIFGDKTNFSATDHGDISGPEYFKISIRLLSRLGICPSDLSVRVSGEKWITVYREGDAFLDQDNKRYTEKGITFLWVEKDQLSLWKDAFSKIIGPVERVIESHVLRDKTDEYFLELVSSMQDLVVDIGLSEDLVPLGKIALEEGMEILKNNEKLLERLLPLLKAPHSFMAKQSIGSCLISLEIAKTLNISSRENNQRVLLASFSQNLGAMEFMIETAEDFGEMESLVKKGDQSSKVTAYKNHPYRSAEIFQECETGISDVDRAIKEHHEFPVGGIPRGVSSNNTSMLGKIMQVSGVLFDYLYQKAGKGLSGPTSSEASEALSERGLVDGPYKVLFEKLKGRSFFLNH